MREPDHDSAPRPVLAKADLPSSIKPTRDERAVWEERMKPVSEALDSLAFVLGRLEKDFLDLPTKREMRECQRNLKAARAAIKES